MDHRKRGQEIVARLCYANPRFDQAKCEELIERYVAEASDEPKVHWLSFTGSEGWLGANIVLAHHAMDAIDKSHRLGINPGGSVMGFQPDPVPPVEFFDRLLKKEDLELMDLLQGGDGKVGVVRCKDDGTADVVDPDAPV